MDTVRKLLAVAAAVLFLAWMFLNWGAVTGDGEGVIRVVLGFFFAAVLFFRRKSRSDYNKLESSARVFTIGVVGTILALVGIVFGIHQLEWLGLILLLASAFKWVFPLHYGRDIVLGAFVLYWIHPLPGKIFGSLQMVMQHLSVRGAEWLLHIFNIRVWADGIILHTGFRVFEVPAACSGMRTIVTVLICLLGVGLLMRLKWYEIPFFMLLGSVQVVILNVLRISFMVYWSGRMPQEWSSTFLHDTLGWFLLLAVILSQAEITWWRSKVLRKEKKERDIEAEIVEEEDIATPLPRFWQLVIKHFIPGLLILLVILGTAFAVYKKRPFHRAMMIADVVEGLIETDLQAAARAVEEALSFLPKNQDLLLAKARIEVRMKDYEVALDTFSKIPEPLGLMGAVMKSWSLMSLGRPEEAMSLVNALPLREQTIPGVALVKAEYAVLLDRPDEVVSNILLASRSSMTLERVRDLFPYLALREQWRTIQECDDYTRPHSDPMLALIAIQACLKTENIAQAAPVIRQAFEKWPADIRLMGALFYMASRRPGSEWEEFFTNNLIVNLPRFDADSCAQLLAQAFQIKRPDLAWLLFRQLELINPDDPALKLAVARFGSEWFVFKCHFLGLATTDSDAVIDIKSFCTATQHLLPFRDWWTRIPLLRELSEQDGRRIKTLYVKKTLEQMERLDKDGLLTERMLTDWPIALALAGRFNDAHNMLDRIIEKYPDKKKECLLNHADFYHAENRWEEAYEAMRQFTDMEREPNIAAAIMMADILIKMNLGLAAQSLMDDAARLFPGSTRIRQASAAAWSSFGHEGQALALLDRNSAENEATLVMLLNSTGRYKEADRRNKSLNLDINRQSRREIMQMPADWLLKLPKPNPLGSEGMKKLAESYAKTSSQSKSPYMAKLDGLVAEFGKNKGGGVDTAVWESAGRDCRERAQSLYRLAVLLSREGKFIEARDVLEKALGNNPTSPILHRFLISLSQGTPAVIIRAREACPDDSAIWVADIASRILKKEAEESLLADVELAIKKKKFYPETYIRIGEMLLKYGYIRAATCAAHRAIEDGEGLLAADVLGLKCALGGRNFKWALACALRGAENALDPVPFYKLIVSLKTAGNIRDADMIKSLEYLATKLPLETKWGEQLGIMYFDTGDTKRALNIIGALIDRSPQDVAVSSLLVAAESARIEGDLAKAITFLETARRIYPERVSILNNLIYVLAQDPATLNKALVLLPELIALDSKPPAVLDTIAFVYAKSGRMDEAVNYSGQALEMLGENDYSALEIELNGAEILLKLGKYKESVLKLESILKRSAHNSVVERRARTLLALARESLTNTKK